MQTDLANYINHFAILGDESGSMSKHASALVTAIDGTVAHLASRSQEWDQETRVTFYTFSDHGKHKCLYYDKDALRMPSVAGRYRPGGLTALIDCVMLALDDLEKSAQLYGMHAFVLYLFSDGLNNDSRHGALALERRILGLPDNWTVAGFAPNQAGVAEMRKCGFPADNITLWDTTSSAGMEEVGRRIRDTSDAFMQGRTQGRHGYSARTGGGLFRMRDFSAAEVTSALPPLTAGSYVLYPVAADERIDQFVARATGHPYQNGLAYYQFMKTETVQPQKQIAVEVNGQVYTGRAARDILGLPDTHVRVKPDQKPGVTIFVQSTSYNRKLVAGTRLLVLR